jgi:SWI/SNF-related matrix-associated actin-dependent regulator 1 of chromatin subfamily A
MKVVEPVHHVTLRHDRYGHEHVVFAFPYKPDVVDAVRAIPGRRFDWEAREWWVPRADATAPYVQGVLEKHDWLTATEDVETWLARAVRGWVGKVTAGRHEGEGVFLLERIAGELPDGLAAAAIDAGARQALPFTKAVAKQLDELVGARLDQRAARCKQGLLVDRVPAPATLVYSQSVGEPRFKLEVNWDPDTIPAFLALPAAESHGRTLPIDPYLLEPLEHYLRTFEVDIASNALVALQDLRREHSVAVEEVRRSRAKEAPRLFCEARLGGELRPFQRAGVRYVLDARRAFLADEQGLGKTVEALAALEEDDAYPAVVICPASLKLNWQREAARWLPQRQVTVLSGTGVAPDDGADITILNYEIVAAHADRLAIRGLKALVLDESHYVKNPRAKRTAATRKLANALPPEALRLALTGTPVMNHPEELIAQLRILGRLEDFGSGAKFARRFQGAGAEERIHWHLRRRCFVRRLKSEVLPQLPAKRQVVVPVALDNEREYRQAEADVIEWLREQPLELSELEARVAATLRAERLAQLNVLRRLAARGKLGAAMAWIDDFQESEEPLVVFSGSREVQEHLLKRFPEALHIVGDDSIQQREAAVHAFQERGGLIICATRVAGQGITLTKASNVAFLDLEWTPAMHDQAEDRLHRIGQEESVTAWYLLAAQTIDETMIELISRKRGIVGAVTDGRADDSEALIQSVVRELRSSPPRRRLRPVA